MDVAGEDDAWRFKVHTKIKAGAARINLVLEAIIDMEMVDILVPMRSVCQKCIFVLNAH